MRPIYLQATLCLLKALCDLNSLCQIRQIGDLRHHLKVANDIVLVGNDECAGQEVERFDQQAVLQPELCSLIIRQKRDVLDLRLFGETSPAQTADPY